MAPCSELLGAFDPAASSGAAALSIRASPWLGGPTGTVYGGIEALLLDVVMTGGTSTVIPAHSVCSPLDLKVHFVRPVWPDGRTLRAAGTVVHRGRRFATTNGRITDDSGDTVALAMSSFVIVAGRDWTSPAVAHDPPLDWREDSVVRHTTDP